MDNEILVEVRMLEDGKATKAFADVILDTVHGDVTICRFSIVHQDGKKPWVAFPQISYPDRETGKYKNIPIVLPSRKLRHAISEAVIAKYAEECNDGTPF